VLKILSLHQNLQKERGEMREERREMREERGEMGDEKFKRHLIMSYL
jgi:hypothetical protein